MKPTARALCLVASLLTARCGGEGDAPMVMSYPDRAPGVRAPLSAPCDPTDPARCQLPWPSNAFTVVDAATATGLRVNLTAQALVEGDDPREANRADGFSRVSPVMTVFPGAVDAASLEGQMRVFEVRAGALVPVPLRYRVIVGTQVPTESLVIAYPRAPMAPAADHVVVVTDGVRTTDGISLRASALTRAAMGLEAPATDEASRLRAYHAPTRSLLRAAGVDLARVLRAWDFTTRSRSQPHAALMAMRERAFRALDEGRVRVVFDLSQTFPSGPGLLEVRGRLTGVPDFVGADGRLVRDARGVPQVADGAEGVHDVPFRVLVPRGAGDYRVALWGHGMGGDVTDDSFDAEITRAGAAKLNLRFLGYYGDAAVLNTFAGFRTMVVGVERSTAGLLQSTVDGQLLFRAMVGAGDDTARAAPLAQALAAPMVRGANNPAAGRYPRAQGAIWTGGSLGGTMGLVFMRSEPRMVAAVLNVPGAGLSHYLTQSNVYSLGRLALLGTYRTDIDINIAVGMAQLNFDDVDGAVWDGAVPDRPMLFQQSMGDPVLPNIGTELAAASAGAAHVGAVLTPVHNCAPAPMAMARSALTQFRVPMGVTAPLDVHGFAARDTPAGTAAREQIESFIRSVWDGAAMVTVPTTCARNTPAGSCDFSSARAR